MSKAFYDIESLRFYLEEEIELREQMIQKFSSTVNRTLTQMNGAWKFYRVEVPILTPETFVSSSYDQDDIFITQISKANQKLVLRPETTVSSYMSLMISAFLLPMPLFFIGPFFALAFFLLSIASHVISEKKYE